MTVRLEHANLFVRNVDAEILFLKTAFPEFSVRGKGTRQGIPWIHIGTDDTYIALNPAKPNSKKNFIPYNGEPGVNHLAYEVDNVESLRTRLKTAGYKESTPPNTHPHRKRVYFYDPEGNDWEFIQYFSNKPAERNDYTLPD